MHVTCCQDCCDTCLFAGLDTAVCVLSAVLGATECTLVLKLHIFHDGKV